jgi:hypothetical protein
MTHHTYKPFRAVSLSERFPKLRSKELPSFSGIRRLQKTKAICTFETSDNHRDADAHSSETKTQLRRCENFKTRVLGLLVEIYLQRIVTLGTRWERGLASRSDRHEAAG